ncbi:MAG TPA: transglutaminase-like domain-containing protein [Rhodanobacteraceae bacterium]|nr:transglutaminase-like domain-containing protein [Rhodanobacteraceae bacterium]
MTLRRRTALLPLLALLTLPCMPASAVAHGNAAGAGANTQRDTWMSVTMEGRKIGSAHLSRVVKGDTVTSTETLRFELERAGTRITIENRETDIESRSGKVLGFDGRTRLSGIENHVHGRRLDDGRVRVERSVGGQSHSHVMDWPARALLSEGQRLAQLRAGLAAGTKLQMRVFDITSGEALTVDRHVIGAETVALPGGDEQLTRIEQVLHYPGNDSAMTLWVDAAVHVRKMQMTTLGQSLELLACDRACATAPNQPASVFSHAMAALPQPLDRAQRRGPLRYIVRSRDSQPLHFASTDEQRVRRDGDQWIIDIGGDLAQREPPPTELDAAATAWLQSADPKLHALALRAAGNARGTAARMHALQVFVNGYIAHKNLGVGYASALETLQTRSGDCTEHAVLLAALARSLAIPARVVTGLVYTPRYAGRENVLVPHAWVQAWVDGHWRSYDAALGGFDSGHLALAVGNGDPWRFYAGMQTLGRLHVVSVAAPRGARDSGPGTRDAERAARAAAKARALSPGGGERGPGTGDQGPGTGDQGPGTGQAAILTPRPASSCRRCLRAPGVAVLDHEHDRLGVALDHRERFSSASGR